MERQLKFILETAKKTGAIYTRKWETFPVPIVPEEDLNRPPQPPPAEYVPSPPPPPRVPSSSASSSSASSFFSFPPPAAPTRGFYSDDIDAVKPQKKKSKKALAAEERAKKAKADVKAAKLAAKNQRRLAAAAAAAAAAAGEAEIDVTGRKKFDPTGWSEATSDAEKRAQRFADHGKKSSSSSNVNEAVYNDDGTLDLDALRVVGTCERLEKPYLRLTSAPDPSTVRPVRVLKKTMEMLQKKWKERTEETSQQVYLYVSEQLRSARQDLTVQNERTNFAVEVYEWNAGVALEMGDMQEFNACQTQLWALYRVPGLCTDRLCEFTAYRILYFVYTSNFSELAATLGDPQFGGFGNKLILHAEMTRQAFQDLNWMSFRHLFDEAPLMSHFLLRLMLPGFLLRCVRTFLASRGPKNVPLEYFDKVMQFGRGSGVDRNMIVLAADRVSVDNAETLKLLLDKEMKV